QRADHRQRQHVDGQRRLERDRFDAELGREHRQRRGDRRRVHGLEEQRGGDDQWQQAFAAQGSVRCGLGLKRRQPARGRLSGVTTVADYSVVRPSKCSSSDSASGLSGWTTSRRCSGGPYRVYSLSGESPVLMTLWRAPAGTTTAKSSSTLWVVPSITTSPSPSSMRRNWSWPSCTSAPISSPGLRVISTSCMCLPV